MLEPPWYEPMQAGMAVIEVMQFGWPRPCESPTRMHPMPVTPATFERIRARSHVSPPPSEW